MIPTCPVFEELIGHDADLAFAGTNQTGTVGTNQPAATLLSVGVGTGYVMHRNTFGDGDDQGNLRIRGFHDGVGRPGARNEDNGRVSSGIAHGFPHGIEDRHPILFGATLAGADASDDRGAEGEHLLGVEAALPTGHALYDQSRVFIYQDRH